MEWRRGTARASGAEEGRSPSTQDPRAGGGEHAKRIVAIAFLIAAIVALAVVRPVAASHRFWATGADVRISLLDHCGNADNPASMEYPANTPFVIFHGWVETPWVADSAANKQAFMGLSTYFEFRIDKVPQPSALWSRYVPDLDWQWKMFLSEYDQGLTGTHRFGGLWYLDGQLVGGTPGEAVFQGGCVVNVIFD